MKVATYNLSKIVRNAWYLKKSQPSMTFSACLRKAWRNEKQMIMTARIEGRTLATAPTSEYCPIPMTAAANDYGAQGQYCGD